VAFFWIHKTVRWGDCDAAQVVWFPHFLEWIEEAEEELYSAIGHPRQHLLTQFGFGMPRVELHTTFHAPARAGDMLRVGIHGCIENPRRIRYEFEIRQDGSDRMVATGYLRVACVDWATFTPRDLPSEVIELIGNSPFSGDDRASAGQ
jgi:YbgC/YbaW family acyl-CoA thioester hydrolase